MASGRGTISAAPSIWIQGPKKLSVKTHRVAVGWRPRLRALSAVSRLLMTAFPGAVDADEDGRGLEAAGGSAGDHHRPVVAGDELAGLVWGHGALLAFGFVGHQHGACRGSAGSSPSVKEQGRGGRGGPGGCGRHHHVRLPCPCVPRGGSCRGATNASCTPASWGGRTVEPARPHGGRYWVLEWDVPAGTFMSAVTDEADDSLFLLQAGRRRERPWGGPPSRGRSPFGGHLGGHRPPRSPVAAAHRHRWAGLSGALGRRRSSRSGRAGVPADPRRPGPRPSGSARSARRSTARSIVWKWPRRHGAQCSRGAAHERPAA
jgi:hypothetical protein